MSLVVDSIPNLTLVHLSLLRLVTDARLLLLVLRRREPRFFLMEEVGSQRVSQMATG